MPVERINGVGIFWQLEGDSGDPLVLVHGSWGDHRNWRPVVPSLAPNFRVVTYDRRGHSRSERPTGQGSVRDDALDLAALVEQLGLAPAHIVGNSFGAAIVLRLATERPGLFRSMVVHEPPLFALLEDRPEAEPALAVARSRLEAVVALLTAGDAQAGARLFVETVAIGAGAWDRLTNEQRETFVFNAPTWLDEMQDPDALTIDLERLRHFPAPTLLTVGGQSPPFFPAVVSRIASVLPHAARHTYERAGHVPHQSHPDEFVDVLRGFLAG